MLELAQNSGTLPAALDALDELIPPDHSCAQLCFNSSRPDVPTAIALWHRIEYQLGVELRHLKLFQIRMQIWTA
jgi:hypothetical protein